MRGAIGPVAAWCSLLSIQSTSDVACVSAATMPAATASTRASRFGRTRRRRLLAASDTAGDAVGQVARVTAVAHGHEATARPAAARLGLERRAEAAAAREDEPRAAPGAAAPAAEGHLQALSDPRRGAPGQANLAAVPAYAGDA